MLWVQKVEDGDTSETIDTIVHRLPKSKLGYCVWVRARNCTGASQWSQRFIFHSPPAEAPVARCASGFKINPFSEPFISSLCKGPGQAGGAPVHWSLAQYMGQARRNSGVLHLAGKSAAGLDSNSSQTGARVSLTDDGWVLNTVLQDADIDSESARLACTSIAGSQDDDPGSLSTYCALSTTDAAGHTLKSRKSGDSTHDTRNDVTR